ncbi:hypothetical protein SAY86_014537 [Trapa natans]|uniref:Neprosin activation peptide domain-containing protein n=1 Tax=Trapa natans TaxID=22666 RepID=A0AAN7L1E0_TRANT|nr:hypothetical protein SAY86_014537 [Trapa natans]
MKKGRQVSNWAAILCFLGLVALSCAAGTDGASRQKLKVEKHLRRLNKPPVKTIKVRPDYHPEGLLAEAREGENHVRQLWRVNGRCPENTIPVRRTKKDDVLRASSVKRYGKKNCRSAPIPKLVDLDLINMDGHENGWAGRKMVEEKGGRPISFPFPILPLSHPPERADSWGYFGQFSHALGPVRFWR